MKLTAKLASDIRLLVASKAQLLILPFKFIKLILLLFQFKHSMGFSEEILLLKYGGLYTDVGKLRINDLNWLWDYMLGNSDSLYHYVIEPGAGRRPRPRQLLLRVAAHIVTLFISFNE
ncbi:hypothetical protein F5B18DRAFT_650214 [Nemania serpens]|nr:hypothetical protein F5B18DRAFT_650214 [Nemania serpens]